HMAKHLTGKQQHQRTERGEDSAADQQPGQNVHVHAHVVSAFPDWWNRRCGSECCGADVTSTPLAEPGVLFDLATALRAIHTHLLHPCLLRRISPFLSETV